MKLSAVAVFLCCISTLLLAGCGTDSANMRIGDAQPYASLEAQRAAARQVVTTSTLPPDAKIIGTVTASRCHRYLMDNPPTPDDVTTDLMVAAYAKGADGIANIKIETSVAGALLKDCWHTLVGTAVAYRNG